MKPIESLKAMARSRKEIIALYAFGSQATGKASPLSDFDVAVLLDDARLAKGKRFDFQLDLIAEAMGACHRSDIDVVLLNELTPIPAYEVIRTGFLVYERDRDQRICYESYIFRRSCDLKAFFERTSS